MEVSHGPIIGEVGENEATVWLRAGVAGAVRVEYWPKERPGRVSSVQAMASAETDFSVKVRLSGLVSGTAYCVRAGKRAGSFRTPPSLVSGRGCSFVFSSCLGGQGYGRPEGDGWTIFDAMGALKPDFVHINGDCIYADCAIEAVSTMPWNKGARCVVPAGAQSIPAASTLTSIRARYKYHLEDACYARFLAGTAVFNTWDDHEIYDDWGAARVRMRRAPHLPRRHYTVMHALSLTPVADSPRARPPPPPPGPPQLEAEGRHQLLVDGICR